MKLAPFGYIQSSARRISSGTPHRNGGNRMTIAIAQVVIAIIFATLLWLISLKTNNVSIVDRCWSLFFIAACAVAWILKAGALINVLLIAVPLLLWGVRLSLHITIRSFSKGEDPRYILLKDKYGHNRNAWALWIVFWPQALLACIINWPLTVAIIHREPPTSYGIIYLGLILFIAGFLLETIADVQLFRFQRRRQNREQVLEKGLWAWSRHPNYFGEAVVWWGFYFISVGICGHLLTVLSPLLMTYLLLRVSGVTMLDAQLKKSKPRYTDYMKRTNAFFPWPPKK